jgi:hypothetical protein
VATVCKWLRRWRVEGLAGWPAARGPTGPPPSEPDRPSGQVVWYQPSGGWFRPVTFHAGLEVTVERVLTDKGNGHRAGASRQVPFLHIQPAAP